MKANTVDPKQQLHRLVDNLPPEQMQAALQYLHYLSADPMLIALLSAASDDEPYTEQQKLRDAEAEAAIARGEGISHEEVLSGLGS